MKGESLPVTRSSINESSGMEGFASRSCYTVMDERDKPFWPANARWNGCSEQVRVNRARPKESAIAGAGKSKPGN